MVLVVVTSGVVGEVSLGRHLPDDFPDCFPLRQPFLAFTLPEFEIFSGRSAEGGVSLVAFCFFALLISFTFGAGFLVPLLVAGCSGAAGVAVTADFEASAGLAAGCARADAARVDTMIATTAKELQNRTRSALSSATHKIEMRGHGKNSKTDRHGDDPNHSGLPHAHIYSVSFVSRERV